MISLKQVPKCGNNVIVAYKTQERMICQNAVLHGLTESNEET
jgi:hypothetical protein